jgi:molecular chaperone GrpE
MADATTEGNQDRAPVEDRNQGEELLALLQRERADFQNYRRRATQERAEDRERARFELLANLLPLLDDLDRVLTQMPQDLAENPWAQGVLLSRQRLIDFLTRAGVERIGAEGEPFDPVSHEALFYEEQPGIGERQVTTVIRPGYRVGPRVLRPAQVGVVGPAEKESSVTAVATDGEDRVVETQD